MSTATIATTDIKKSKDVEPKTKAKVVNPENLAWWTILVLILVTITLVLLFGWFQRAWQAAFVELALAVAALAVGGMFGFLFGIPRTGVEGILTNGDIDAAKGGSATNKSGTGAEQRVTYKPSTSLEQVAEWLTKILLGAGLVQFGNISQALAEAGATVSSAFRDRPAGIGVLTQIIIVTFVVIGFLASYLWTRIHYSRVQIIADRDAASAAQAKADLAYATATEARKETTETKERLGEVMSGALVVPGTARAFSEPTGNAQSWPAEILNRIERLKSAPVNWDVDTVGEIFGSHAPESNGRKLEAMIETDEGDSLVISLRVSTVPSAAPLEGEVTFLLDPTYPHRIITKRVRNSWAILKISAAEWFTVAAIADEGRTVLTYSLRQLPGAPEWFKVGDG